MSDHRIEFDTQCKSCNGTGLYVGMAERDGFAIVCSTCKGTGKFRLVIEYKDFEKRKKQKDVKRVLQVNCGIIVGTRKDDNSLDSFGGMSYKDWLAGKEFRRGMEMRAFTCPAWYYQSADYDKKPDWEECTGWGGSFSSCSEFSTKSKCWERFDKEQEQKELKKGNQHVAGK